MNDKVLVLFDFDGTITRVDSFFKFIQYYAGNLALVKGLFSTLPTLVSYKTNRTSGGAAKEKIISHFFRNASLDVFDNRCKHFAELIVPRILNAAVVPVLQQHQQQRHRIVVVTASLENYVKPWAEAHQLGCIATQLEVQQNKLTGRFSSPNCNGEEKARRIKASLNLAEYTDVYAYGNSKGDIPMLSLASKPFFIPSPNKCPVPFKPTLN
jgi:HAD superfamily hydrolase (TIGR01490 family)